MSPINISYIYCVLNIQTEKRYVGSTTRWSHRKRDHLHRLRNHKHYSKIMQEDFDTYGEESFKFFVLEEVKTFERDELFEREQFWIDKYSPEYNTNPVAGNNFVPWAITTETRRVNATGHIQSQEEKDKRANSIKEFWKVHPHIVLSPEKRQHLREINLGENNPNYGLKRSDETKRKLSDSNAKKIWVGFISPDGVEFRSIRNLQQFAKERNLSPGCMRELGYGRLKTHKGWKRIET